MIGDPVTPYNQYRLTQIQTASPMALVVMLYDGAIRVVGSARRHMMARQLDAAHNDLVRAQDIIRELMLSLNFEAGAEIAQNLYLLYDFMVAELVRANVTKDVAILEPVLKMLSELRGAWAEISLKGGEVTAEAK